MSPGRRDMHMRHPGADIQPRVAHALRLALTGAALVMVSGTVCAFTATLTPVAPKTIYLQIGNGTFTGGNYTPTNINGSPGGSPGKNTTINTVSVSVPAASVGNKTAQVMTTNSTASDSFWDGYAFCNAPAQLYIGGFYRTTGNGSGTINVTANVPAALTDGSGDTISFGSISWTSSGNADTGSEPFPSATFTPGAVQTIGAIAQNQWRS